MRLDGIECYMSHISLERSERGFTSTYYFVRSRGWAGARVSTQQAIRTACFSHSDQGCPLTEAYCHGGSGSAAPACQYCFPCTSS